MDDRHALKVRFASFGTEAPPPLPDRDGHVARSVSDLLSNASSPQVMPQGFDRVQLKVRRSQNNRIVGGVGFSVHFIAELSPEARNAVRHYRLGNAVLFQKDLNLKLTANLIVAIWRVFKLWFTRRRWRVTVNDLVQGRTLTAKDVIEMLDIESDMRKAAETFAKVLRAAAWFGGEEIVEL